MAPEIIKDTERVRLARSKLKSTQAESSRVGGLALANRAAPESETATVRKVTAARRELADGGISVGRRGRGKAARVRSIARRSSRRAGALDTWPALGLVMMRAWVVDQFN